MKRFLLATAFAVIATAASATPTNFYDGGSVGNWTVFGNPGEGQQAPACVSETTWDDGSKFQLIKDVADGDTFGLRIMPGRSEMLQVNILLG